MFDPPLMLVSPASSDTGISADGVSPWLDDFFGNCTVIEGCEPDMIEHIAFHNYYGSIERLNSTIYGMVERYKKTDGTKRPLWLTEIGLGYWNPPDGPPYSEKIDYMKKLLPFLDANPHIYRYAWFTARRNPGDMSWSGKTSLLQPGSNDTTPTELGELYRDL